MADRQGIVKYKKPLQFNIGLVFFVIIILYVIFHIFSYMTRKPIAEYQVSQGSIVSNNTYRALILRDESVVYAQEEGYINYYAKNASKVSVNDVIYSIDKNGSLSKQIKASSSDGSSLPKSAMSQVSSGLDVFIKNYDSARFSYVYDFKDSMNSELKQLLNSMALNNLSAQIVNAEAQNTFRRYCAGKQGLALFYVDGYEGVTPLNFTSNAFDYASYNKQSLQPNDFITGETPVFKLVNGEDWNLVIPIDEAMVRRLSDSSVVKVRFCEDDFTTTVIYEIVYVEEKPYVVLTLHNSMVRYANERFCEVELVLSNTTGLKIPKSAITSKEFFTVPHSYFMSGNDSKDMGLIISDETGDRAVYPTIYYSDDVYYYIDGESVSSGMSIKKPDSILTTYVIGTDTKSLTGVYNINKGYAVFKQITILYENEEYAIVEPKTSYGISLYDHIALDGSKLKEDQLITK